MGSTATKRHDGFHEDRCVPPTVVNPLSPIGLHRVIPYIEARVDTLLQAELLFGLPDLTFLVRAPYREIVVRLSSQNRPVGDGVEHWQSEVAAIGILVDG